MNLKPLFIASLVAATLAAMALEGGALSLDRLSRYWHRQACWQHGVLRKQTGTSQRKVVKKMTDAVDKLEAVSHETRIALSLLDYVLEDVSAPRESVLGNQDRITNILNVLWERLCSLDEMQQELVHELMQKKCPSRAATPARAAEITQSNCKL